MDMPYLEPRGRDGAGCQTQHLMLVDTWGGNLSHTELDLARWLLLSPNHKQTSLGPARANTKMLMAVPSPRNRIEPMKDCQLPT